MSSNATTSAGGAALLPTLLGVLFVGLKLTGEITWPWIWVLAPFWAGIALWLGFVLILLVGGGIALGIAALFDSRSRR